MIPQLYRGQTVDDQLIAGQQIYAFGDQLASSFA